VQATRQVDALVLSVSPFQEQDRLLTLLSPRLGLVRGVARGARRHSSHLFAATSPLVLMRAAVRCDSSGFCDVREARLLEAFAGDGADPVRLAYLSAISELARAIVNAGPIEDVECLFTDTVAALRAVASGDRPRLAMAYMAAGQFARLGIAPDWTECGRCGATLISAQGAWCSLADGPLCQACAGVDKHALAVPAAVQRTLVAAAPPPGCGSDSSWSADLDLSRAEEDALYELVTRLLREWGGIVLKSLQIAERLEPPRARQAGIDPSS